MSEVVRVWVAGRAVEGETTTQVRHPFDGRLVAQHWLPSTGQVEKAISAAWEVREHFASTSALSRSKALLQVADRLRERRDEFADTIVAENGKPLAWARSEVDRASSTFGWAAEEVRRWSGDLQRLDTDIAGLGRLALVRRFSRGPVLAITPFNFPLNLVAHKVAPALAVGSPVIIKPAPSTPLTALLLGDLLSETDLPAGSWSVLPVPNSEMDDIVRDPRLPVVSFTGSGHVGHQLLAAVPAKHVTLELGGNAAAVVCEDYSTDQDLDAAADRIALFGTYQAGQSCIAVQRVLVHESLRDALQWRLERRMRQLVLGDPLDPETHVGPMIDQHAAARVEQWVEEATSGGAKLLVGGPREGATMPPTLLLDPPAGAKVLTEEIFGPVLVLQSFDDLDQAFDMVNDSRFGLQVGIFTHNLQTAFEAHARLEVGGVIIGDVPTYRADQLPYGGVKESGRGREGVLAAMADLTYEKVLVLSGIQV